MKNSTPAFSERWSVLAHDVKNKLSIIVGRCELMAERNKADSDSGGGIKPNSGDRSFYGKTD